MDARTGTDVQEFYKTLQFNVTGNPKTAAELIKGKNNIQYIYPDIRDLHISNNLLEIGCGAGWFSNSTAYYYGLDVTAIDLNPSAIEAAQKTAKELDVDVQFECADLFAYECEPKDIVISIGVLHHTNNTMGGIKKCIDLTRHGGKIFIGLYHKYGRKPFLDYFEKLKKENSDEDYLFKKYRELDPRHGDGIQAKSWFRDQVLHPYESQHTLREVAEIFQSEGVKLIGTSINHYEEISCIDELYLQEQKLYDVGMKYLSDQKYFPGFFYVLGEKV